MPVPASHAFFGEVATGGVGLGITAVLALTAWGFFVGVGRVFARFLREP